MLILLLAVVSSAAYAQVAPLNVCLSKTDGGLACKCSSTHTVLMDLVLDIDCSSRNISDLPTNWEISLDASRLDLSRNQLSSLAKEQFSRWGNLEELSLSRNKFTSLDEGVFLGLAKLRILDLSFNMLTNLPEKIFGGLSILSSLNLEMNRLQSLHPALFVSTPQIDSLSLGYNPDLGKSIKKSADFLTVVLERNLTSLKLNSMAIDILPTNLFSEASQLRHLSLADNPMNFVDLFPPSLESLNLSGTDIEAILSGDFVSYPKLKTLRLDRSVHLKRVQENAFEGLQSLEVLTMENCIQLHEFDERAFGGPESPAVPLKRFSLSRGGLHTLSSKIILPLEPTLEHLSLDGNPWRCDCKLTWIRHINFSLESVEYLRCFSPEQHHNKLLLSVEPKDFVCTHESAGQKTYPGLVIVLDVFLIVIVLVISAVILMILRNRGFSLCTPRQKVGTYSQVTIEPNRAELEWDDRDLDHIWSTPISNKAP